MSALDWRTLTLRLAGLQPERRTAALRGLTAFERRYFHERWAAWAHAGQLAPDGDWRVWLIRAGRGFGKTRAGAEWVGSVARTTPGARIALIGGTAEDVRRVMVEGASGLLATAHGGDAIEWRREAGEIRWASGARAFVYSAEAPDKLRGPEHHAAWCDELAKWRYGEAAWDNLMMGLRLGGRPRVVVTTTPRPVPLMRRVMALPGLVETRGATRDNAHLPETFIAEMEASYGGTRLGRQELGGELIEDVVGALWTRARIEACRVGEVPAFRRVVVGVDPPVEIGGDACGIVAVGLGEDGRGYVIEDASVVGASPEQWAHAVAVCAARVRADRVVAEVNQGGQLVADVLHAAVDELPVKKVRASRGKVARAEPVAALYERGKVSHVGCFPVLEDELCGLVVGGGYEGPGRSPDRADALVWAVTELMLGRQPTAKVRSLGEG